MSDPDADELNRAYGRGYLAGRNRDPVLSCPYDGEVGPLQRRWARGYAAGKEDRTPDWVTAALEWLRRVWYGNEEES